MSGAGLMIAAMLVPVLAAALIPLCHRAPNLREAVTLIGGAVTFALVLKLLGLVAGGMSPQVTVLEFQPGVALAFRIEPLGMLFAAIASGLWIVNSIYSIGYMRGHDEPRQTSFYVCFAIAIASALGIAFAQNLVTLFLFYEVLTLSTYPLVTHKASDEARRGGRIYLLFLLGTSMVLLLPAIIWTQVLAGSTDFTAGGLLSDRMSPLTVGVLLGLFAFGIGKAALMPFHRWLPAAMVAPTPVSALLHAVAVVKAGSFTMLKVVVYIFGLDLLTGTGASEWLAYVAGFTIVTASLIAMTKDNLKARLAYSTVSQLSYMVLGAALANAAGVLGGGMQMLMHAFGKMTLFMCAGAIYVTLNKTEVSELKGLGRVMPFTFTAFLIGALSIIGVPPLGGAWSKLYLMLGSLEGQHLVLAGVLLASSLLNIAYLLPIPMRAFFLKSDDKQGGGVKEAPVACLIAMGVTSFGCIVLFFFPTPVFELLKPLVAASQP